MSMKHTAEVDSTECFNRLFRCNETCYCVGLVSVTSTHVMNVIEKTRPFIYGRG